MTAGRKRILIATHELPWVASLRKRPATTTSPPLTSSTAVTNNASSNPVHNADVNCYRNSVSVESSESPGVQESEETETLADFEWNFADRRRHSALFSAIRALARNGLGLQAFEEEEEEVLHVGLAGTLFDRNQQPISLSPLVKSSPAFTSASDGGYSFLEKMNSQHAAYSAPNLAEEVGTADSPAAVPARELDALRSSLREQLMAEKSCVPVFVDKHVSFGHYEGFCKSNIWPLFHYIMWDQATDGYANN